MGATGLSPVTLSYENSFFSYENGSRGLGGSEVVWISLYCHPGHYDTPESGPVLATVHKPQSHSPRSAPEDGWRTRKDGGMGGGRPGGMEVSRQDWSGGEGRGG